MESCQKNDPVSFEDGDYEARLWIDEHGLVCCVGIGFESFESSKKIVSILQEYHRKIGRKFRLCLDATEFTGLAPESRKYMRDNVLGKDSVVSRFAVFGGPGASFATRIMFNMYAKVSNIPMRVFKAKAEAFEWLLGD